VIVGWIIYIYICSVTVIEEFISQLSSGYLIYVKITIFDGRIGNFENHPYFRSIFRYVKLPDGKSHIISRGICHLSLWKFSEEAKSQDEAKEDDNGSFRQSREPRRMETDEAWQDGMMGC